MFLCFWALGFLYKLVNVFIFFSLGLLVEFPCFLKLMCLYIEVPKIDVDTFGHILNLISLKRRFSLFLAYASGYYQRLI